MKKYYILFLAAIPLTAQSQNNTSPYSIVGIGDIRQNNFDRSAGIGNTGISLSSEKWLYHTNPASYAALSDHFFTMEVSALYKTVTYKGESVPITGNKSSDLSFEKLAMAIKMKPRWGLSFGLLPYSTSNYSFTSKKTIQGTNLTADALYEGTGGLNNAYVANAFSLFKNLQVGLQTNLLFGNFTRTETLYTDAIGLTSLPVITTTKIYTSKINFKAGLQYQAKLGKSWKLNIGATASNRSDLSSSDSVSVSQNSTQIYQDETYTANRFTIPVMYAAGISVVHNNAFTVAVDYSTQNWNTVFYKGFNYTVTDASRYSAGVEYSLKKPYLNGWYEKYFVQSGVFYNKSYLQVYGTQINDYGITAGIGFNAKRSSLGWMLSAEYGSRGTVDAHLIKENYLQMGVTLTYRDFWFTRAKRY